MLAVNSGFSNETIEKLIDLGCDINAAASDGMTALHASYYCENKETFEFLLKKGADPNIADDAGDTGKSLAEDDSAFRSIL